MIENWGRPGMPPIRIDVLHRETFANGEEEIVIIAGYHVHLGKPIQGWTGTETIVHRRALPEGGYKILKNQIRPSNNHK